ncbi:MAG: DUF1800 family protein [Caulobacterales bacterium]|nr:DUF1800 family protein [Caulobacterales bacterium]
MATPNDLNAAIAVTRFGLGARPGEIATASADPQGWVRRQIRRAGADRPQEAPETSATRIKAFRAYRQDRRAMEREADGEVAADRDPVQIAARMLREDTAVDFLARARLAATTPAGFRERWTLFWCNHFTVSAVKLLTATVTGPFEQEAIRPRVFGRFEDMLVASSAHPAMLMYLDQAQSVGPHSPAAAFLRRRPMPGVGGGLNENLAREILELHTVGVDAGYSQDDVTEFARALTGWSVGGLREVEDQQGEYVFRMPAHEPGGRTVMGKTYAAAGLDQGLAILKDLAAHPATARHICTKIARHFVADDPPPALVARLEATWKATNGDLGHVAETLVAAPEAWDPAPRKLKTPYEFLISSWRAIGGQPGAIEHIAPPLNAMGMRAFSAPSPKGWSDEAMTWAAPDAIIKRMSWAEGFSAVVAADLDPSPIAAGALGARLSEPVRKAVARAESRQEALSVLLMSPEFQRR